jgi:hypothetical protein
MFRSPAVVLIASVILGAAGTTLLAVTADEGGIRVYHPFEWIGLGIDVVAALLLIISGLGYYQSRTRKRR